MRIQYVIASLTAAGTERRCVLLANEAARRGHQVQVVVGQTGPLAELLAPEVTLVDLAAPAPFLRRGGPRRLWRSLRAFRPEVYHGFTNVGAWYGAIMARALGVRRIVASAGTPATRQAFSRGEMLMARWALRAAHRVTVNSLESERTYRAAYHLAEPRLVYLPNFVDTQAIGPGEVAVRAAVRAELGLAPDEVACVCVGRLHPVKNQLALVEAMASLSARHPRARLLLVGDGPQQGDLAVTIARHGLGQQVRLLGLRRDVPRLLQGMDLFLLPSLREGMSNALLEAMAAGLPAVVTDVGSNAELVTDGQTGFVAAEPTAPSVAGALDRALSDPAALPALGAAARRRAETDFDQGVVIDRYFALYEQQGTDD